MKIQQSRTEFQPVCITLDSVNEVQELLDAICYSAGYSKIGPSVRTIMISLNAIVKEQAELCGKE